LNATLPACAISLKEQEWQQQEGLDPLSKVPRVRIDRNDFKKIASVLSLLALTCALVLNGQDKPADAGGKAANASKDASLTIIVTSGEDKKPVDSASVYVKFVEEHKHSRDKKIEMNLKTNLSGVCHVPVIPPGKFLIQVIAPGWKTFGEYYDINQTEQTINIELVRPPKWY
jgi:hypothetical protein